MKKRDETYWKRRNAGLCGRCGSKLDETGFALCRSCREITRKNSVIEREKRRERGLCIRCGRNRDIDGCCYCRRCRKSRKIWLESRNRPVKRA